MAKKSFQSGLDDLFMDALESSPEAEEKTMPSTKTQKKKKTTKNFSADLDALFQETIEESVKEQATQLKQGKKSKSKPKSKTKRTKPSFGLDALIRQTVKTSKVSIPKDTKRVTFVFDKKKIEKLKSIARLEKAYLKDIVDSLVSEYIAKHEN